MDISHEIPIILQKAINKFSKNQLKYVQYTNKVKLLEEKEVYYKKRRLDAEKKLFELAHRKAKLEESIREIVALLEECKNELISLNCSNNKNQKKILKLRQQLEHFYQLPDGIKLAKEDENIFHKKFLKSTSVKKILRLFVDSNPPKNICRGFVGDPQLVSLHAFELQKIDENDEMPLSDRLWLNIEKCSEFKDSFENLFAA